MSSRLILSLRHHAAKQDPLSNQKSSNAHPFATNKLGVNSQHNGAFGLRSDIGGMGGEKGTSDRGHGIHAHIALDNLGSTFRKGDEESQDGHQTHTIPGVFVVTETKTAVDDVRH